VEPDARREFQKKNIWEVRFPAMNSVLVADARLNQASPVESADTRPADCARRSAAIPSVPGQWMGTSLAAQRRLHALPLPASPSLSSPPFSFFPSSPHFVRRVRLLLAALVAVLALPLAAAHTAAAATVAATPPPTATPAALVPGDTCQRYVPSRWLLSSPPWALPTCPWRTGGRPAVPLAAAVDEAAAADAAAAAAVVHSRRTAHANGSHVGGGGHGGSNAPPPLRPVVIILTHTAVANLRRTLTALARTPAADRAPYAFVVSVDVGGSVAPVRRLVRSEFSDLGVAVWEGPSPPMDEKEDDGPAGGG